MSCEKHGYTNNTMCPACDAEIVASQSKVSTRLTDAELEALKEHQLPAWEIDEALSELIERRAADAKMREALEKAEKLLESFPRSLGAEYSGLPEVRAALAPYRSQT